MDSMRSLVKLWACFTILIVAYAFLDLGANPWLRSETHFTMQPDWSQATDLVHWGGRLLKEGAVVLLIGNAIVVGGLLALVVRTVVRWLAPSVRAERDSVVPGPVSVPPPR